MTTSTGVPTMTDDERRTLAFDLAEHPDTLVTAADGTTWRLTVEPDPFESGADYVNGMDAWGRVAYVERDRNTGLPAPRPDGFDGMARKVYTYDGDAYWWQPLPELWGRGRAEYLADTDDVRSTIEAVREMLTWGPNLLRVERIDGTDAYGSPIVRAFHVIGGVDTSPEVDYLADLAADMLRELTDD